MSIIAKPTCIIIIDCSIPIQNVESEDAEFQQKSFTSESDANLMLGCYLHLVVTFQDYIT